MSQKNKRKRKENIPDEIHVNNPNLFEYVIVSENNKIQTSVNGKVWVDYLSR